MNKDYLYRKHIRVFNKIIPLTLFILGSLLFILTLVLILIRDPEGYELLPVFVFITVFTFSEGFIIRYFYRKLATTVVTLNDEGVRFKNIKEDFFVKYEEIKKVGNPSIKYTGGWITIESNKKPIRLTVVIERIHEFIIDLKQQLDSHGLSNVYDEKSLFNFLKTATYSDNSWNRLYHIFFKFLGLQLLTPIIEIGLLITLDISRSANLLIFINILLPTIFYIITEIIFGRKMRQLMATNQFKVVDLERDYENSIYKKYFMIGLLTFIIIQVFILLV